EVASAAFSPEGRRIVTVSWDRTVRVWSADGSREPIVLHGHEDLVWSISFSPDGRRMVTVSRDKTARVWNVDGSDPGHAILLRKQDKAILAAVFSLDGERIITAFNDMTTQEWSLSIPALQQDLRAASTDCLPPNLRRTYLDKSDALARAAYETCERSHGR